MCSPSRVDGNSIGAPKSNASGARGGPAAGLRPGLLKEPNRRYTRRKHCREPAAERRADRPP